MVEVDGDTINDVEFVPVDSVRFLHVDFEIDAVRDLAELRDSLESRLDACRDEHPGRGLIVRGTLTGRGPVFDDLKRAGVVDEILRELRDAGLESIASLKWPAVRPRVRQQHVRCAVERISPRRVIPTHYNVPLLLRRRFAPADDQRFKREVEKLGVECTILRAGESLTL